jgi:hypothetical protein
MEEAPSSHGTLWLYLKFLVYALDALYVQSYGPLRRKA